MVRLRCDNPRPCGYGSLNRRTERSTLPRTRPKIIAPGLFFARIKWEHLKALCKTQFENESSSIPAHGVSCFAGVKAQVPDSPQAGRLTPRAEARGLEGTGVKIPRARRPRGLSSPSKPTPSPGLVGSECQATNSRDREQAVIAYEASGARQNTDPEWS